MGTNKPLAIVDCFKDITDPRVDRTKKHLLVDIITIGLCTILSGGESFNDMELFGSSKEAWLKGFLRLPNGIPSHDTFRRVFSSLDPTEFEKSFSEWIRSVVDDIEERHIAIDGKALRASSRKRKAIPPVHLVSAWCTENSGILLGQTKTNKKSNEIKAIPELLHALELKGAIVSIDAAGCQKEIARQIVDNEGDYILALKGNQKSTFENVKEHFHKYIENNIKWRNSYNFCDYFDDSHGRTVRRRAWTIHDIAQIEALEKWPGAKSVIVVEAIRQEYQHAPVTSEFRYYISSLSNHHGSKCEKLVRNHWLVENQLHWVLDVTFSEDVSRISNETSSQNIGLLRRIAISLLKQEKSKKISLRQKKLKCGFDDKYLLAVLSQLGKN